MKRNKDSQRRHSLMAFAVSALLAIAAMAQVVSFDSAQAPAEPSPSAGDVRAP